MDTAFWVSYHGNHHGVKATILVTTWVTIIATILVTAWVTALVTTLVNANNLYSLSVTQPAPESTPQPSSGLSSPVHTGGLFRAASPTSFLGNLGTQLNLVNVNMLVLVEYELSGRINNFLNCSYFLFILATQVIFA